MENQLLKGFFLVLMYVAEEQRLEWLGNRLEQQGSKGWIPHIRHTSKT